MALVAVLAAVAMQRVATRGQRMCGGASARLDGIWELGAQGERRAAIHRAFLGTGRAFAEETWTRVSRVLDDYSRRWTAMYTDTCEATHVRGDQSAEVLDLRMTCLEGPRGALKALTDVFANASGAVVLQAVNAVHALPPLEPCSRVAELRAAVPLPADPAYRARVTDAKVRLAEVKALGDTGELSQARENLRSLLIEARSLAYDPLLAECLVMESWILEQMGHPDESPPVLEQAIWTALAGHRDDVALDSVGLLISVNGYFLDRKAEARRWQPLGEALLRRVGPGHEQSASWFHQGLAMGHERAGEYEQALADLDQALALKRAVLPANHPDLARTLSTMANVRGEMGDHLGALAAADQALDIYVRAYGGSNPMLARELGNRGETLEALGRHAEAERDLRQAVDLAAAWVGPDHPWAAYSMTALGKTLIAEKRPREAAALLENALRIRERAEPNRELVAETRFALAKARWDRGQDPGGARTLAESALAEYRALPAHARDAAEVRSWLEARGGGSPAK